MRCHRHHTDPFFYFCVVRCRPDEFQQQRNTVRQKNDDENAGRRVYEQLLLNAWRRRRNEAKILTETCQKLQEEVCVK